MLDEVFAAHPSPFDFEMRGPEMRGPEMRAFRNPERPPPSYAVAVRSSRQCPAAAGSSASATSATHINVSRRAPNEEPRSTSATVTSDSNNTSPRHHHHHR